jgi:acetyl esterase/lipase
VSLCVKLYMENIVDVDALIKSRQRCDDVGESEQETEPTMTGLRLPDAIMLSCPALNLTLELSPSRVMGIEDPVLPSGLISAISDAYIPSALGTSKKDPLASPFYTPDDVMWVFPPTLIFACSDNPLLDNSIYFNW